MHHSPEQFTGLANRPRAIDAAVSLQCHHAQCEVNYLHLQRLLPGFRTGDELHIGCSERGGSVQQIRLCVLERSRYTAVVRLIQDWALWGRGGIELDVRVYLDVAMAEVVGSPPLVSRLRPRYPYPNSRMLARDEKWQLNCLLGEWLACCFETGHLISGHVFTSRG